MKRVASAAVLLGCLLGAQPASAAIALVGTPVDFYNSGAASSMAFPSVSHTAGNTVIVVVSQQGVANNISSISNTALDTWQHAGSEFAGTGQTNLLNIYYVCSTAGNGSDVVTVNLGSSAAFRAGSVYEFSGMDTSTATSCLNTTASGTAGGGVTTAIATSSITLSASSEVIVAIMEMDGSTATAGTGYTLRAQGAFFAAEYHITSSSEAATATAATNGKWTILAGAFKGAAGVGGATSWFPGMTMLGVGMAVLIGVWTPIGFAMHDHLYRCALEEQAKARAEVEWLRAACDPEFRETLTARYERKA